MCVLTEYSQPGALLLMECSMRYLFHTCKPVCMHLHMHVHVHVHVHFSLIQYIF
jgi:hypothetical protein